MPELAYDLYGDTFVEVPTRAEEEAAEDMRARYRYAWPEVMTVWMDEVVQAMEDALYFGTSWYTEYHELPHRAAAELKYKYDYIPDTRPHWQKLNARGKHWMR